MDITFWVIQAVLLTPVLFMAASVGMEDSRPRPRSSVQTTDVCRHGQIRAATRDCHAERGSGCCRKLRQFTAEQQARLVILRSFVREARSGRGALSDDLAAAAPEVPPRTERPPRKSWRPRLGVSS